MSLKFKELCSLCWSGGKHSFLVIDRDSPFNKGRQRKNFDSFPQINVSSSQSYVIDGLQLSLRQHGTIKQKKDLLQQLVKSQDAIRKNFNLLKFQNKDTEKVLSETFKPITDPLQQLINLNTPDVQIKDEDSKVGETKREVKNDGLKIQRKKESYFSLDEGLSDSQLMEMTQ